MLFHAWDSAARQMYHATSLTDPCHDRESPTYSIHIVHRTPHEKPRGLDKCQSSASYYQPLYTNMGLHLIPASRHFHLLGLIVVIQEFQPMPGSFHGTLKASQSFRLHTAICPAAHTIAQRHATPELCSRLPGRLAMVNSTRHMQCPPFMVLLWKSFYPLNRLPGLAPKKPTVCPEHLAASAAPETCHDVSHPSTHLPPLNAIDSPSPRTA